MTNLFKTANHLVQMQFNKSFGHAKVFGLYQHHNKVERTHNAEDEPPLCVLDASYIKCMKMVNWERDVEQMQNAIQNSNDDGVDFKIKVFRPSRKIIQYQLLCSDIPYV